jgi:hypothetical protein
MRNYLGIVTKYPLRGTEKDEELSWDSDKISFKRD